MKYDKDVDVYFQINAWIDAEVNVHSVDQPCILGLLTTPLRTFLTSVITQRKTRERETGLYIQLQLF